MNRRSFLRFMACAPVAAPLAVVAPQPAAATSLTLNGGSLFAGGTGVVGAWVFKYNDLFVRWNDGLSAWDADAGEFERGFGFLSASVDSTLKRTEAVVESFRDAATTIDGGFKIPERIVDAVTEFLSDAADSVIGEPVRVDMRSDARLLESAAAPGEVESAERGV